MPAELSPASVSICIPVFNGAAFLDEAITSARSQSQSAGEILIVDDCSTDDSLAIAERHQAEDSRIVVIRNSANHGLVGNWNECITRARYPWVKFLFQDDLLDEGCLERLCVGMASSGARLGFVARRVLAEGESASMAHLAANIQMRNVANALSGPRFLDPAAISRLAVKYGPINVLGEPTSVLFHKQLVADYGTFDAGFRQLCDWEYWLRVGSNEGLWFDNRILATFRVHGAATSATNQDGYGRALVQAEAARLSAKLLFHPAFSRLRDLGGEEATWSIGRQYRRTVARLRRWSPGNPTAVKTLGSLEEEFGTLPVLGTRDRFALRLYDLTPARVRIAVSNARRHGAVAGVRSRGLSTAALDQLDIDDAPS